MAHPLEASEGPRPFDGTVVQQARDFIQDARDRWKFRRIMIFGAVALLGAVLVMLALAGDGDKFSACVWAFVTLVMTYIGAPVADDFLQTLPSRRAA